ncbi:MAG TPA: sialidase family protein [Kofleriaceae bacterium]
MRFVAATAVVLAALGGSPAHANGRAPVTNGVHFQTGDPRSLYVATTFGLLVSHDDGCTFRWICEQNIGYGGTFDPKYRIAADGTLFATTFSGLRVSRDGGCTFTTATAEQAAGSPGALAGIWIDAIDIGPTGEVWVATADSGRPNNIYRSTDNGVTFAPRGMLSPSIWWKSLAIAATRPQRVYATGYQVAGVAPDAGQLPPTAHFEITDDGGDTWTESPLAGVAYGPTPLVYAVGVDHLNPDMVFMTSTGANPPSGDRLYRSIDGGVTWTDVLATQGQILDVAITQAGIMVATLAGGYQSLDAGATFAPIANSPQLACVGQRSDGAIFGCAANWQPDNEAVARTATGATWDKVFRFSSLSGAVECPAGTGQHEQCESQWPTLQKQFGADGPATCGAAPPVVDAPVVTPPAASGGCCDADASSPGALVGIAAIAAIVGLVTWRRRGRKKACCS